jgi:tetratricopeptide (TPR) repeat protein
MKIKSANTVKIWEEQVTIPTYGIGLPDKNPMFLEKRVYQGSSGAVYPHPVIDRVADEKRDESWHAVYLENQWLKIMILPELGGRVQMAQDKTNGYHFIYYNQVIKPALVGLAGPWISGGIEFNWPQHHRPSTFEPVEYKLQQNPDGSATVWCVEIERMFRTKQIAAFTLYPDRAYLEIKVQLYNRTSEPQTFLWWANPAVHVNDDYQSVFPPDVHAVMDHGKRAVSDFPVATGTYYKVNYAPGTDISRYKNIPVPTSYMAYHSDFNFVGCYDHGQQAGMMHIANHHLVPGKKQWTWGHSDFGRAWDRQLTDEDGPYIELMCGAFTDNQPDFSWLMPGEEKTFTQIFLPYKNIGGARNASSEVVLNLEVARGRTQLGVYCTRPRKVTVELWNQHKKGGRKLCFTKKLTLSPEIAWNHTLRLGRIKPQSLTLRVLDDQGLELLSYTPLPETKPDIPTAATAAKEPQDIASNEELFLNGQHLEQYRHATYAPEPYYEAALRRDPLDSRCNNALGLLLLRRGKFSEAEPYFRTAIKSLTRRNPNPYDGEPYYNLGLCLKFQGRYHEAFDAFYKAVWNHAWQNAAFFELARLASRAGRMTEALELTERSLETNARHHKARHLRIILLRKRCQPSAALREIACALQRDPLEYGALYEKHRLGKLTSHQFLKRVAFNCFALTEIALDYAHAGQFDEAADLLRLADECSRRPQKSLRSPERAVMQGHPMALYYLGWVLQQKGDCHAAAKAFGSAQKAPPEYCFPNEIECVPALQTAMQANPKDPRAPYYLGNFWYARRRHDDAIQLWERSAKLDSRFPTVQRNLALAYYNQRHNATAALRHLAKAFALDPTDARVFFELDQLYKKLNEAPAKRLARLEKFTRLVVQRDDLTIETITLLNLEGRHAEALAHLLKRNFHPWEGGEGKTTGQYVQALLGLARAQLQKHEFQEARLLLERARVYPANLGEGKLYGAQENQLNYFLGLTHRGLGNAEQARACFMAAAVGLSEPTSAMYYNDQPPDMIFYQGLARRELGRATEAAAIFQTLVSYGETHLHDEVKMDYFAVSLPDFLVFDDDLNLRNRIHCHYLMGLGNVGLGRSHEAFKNFNTVLKLQTDHQGARVHREWGKTVVN